MAAGLAGAAAVPPAGSPAGEVVDAVVTWVHAAIAADRKVTALKTLQVGYRLGGCAHACVVRWCYSV